MVISTITSWTITSWVIDKNIGFILSKIIYLIYQVKYYFIFHAFASKLSSYKFFTDFFLNNDMFLSFKKRL